jgi:hypothetical protein
LRRSLHGADYPTIEPARCRYSWVPIGKMPMGTLSAAATRAGALVLRVETRIDR